MAKCSECNGTRIVPDYVPCTTCKGKGFLIVNGKPVSCTANCNWGQVHAGNVACLHCKGTGREPKLRPF